MNGVGGIGVPPQLVLTSTRGSCTQNVNLVSCNAGNIEGFGSWTVTIRGVVTASAGTTLNNTVGVTGTKSAQTFNTTTTTTTLVSGGGGQLPDLTIPKTGPTTVAVNRPMTYTLTVNNIGTLPTSGVTVVDTVPAGLTSINANGTSLFTCGVVGQTVTCTGGLINQGTTDDHHQRHLARGPGTITNNAVVDPDDAIDEVNELNNTSALVNTQVTTGPPAPDLSINLTDNSAVIAGAGPDPVNPGATLIYKILVTNTHPTRADDVEMVNGTQGLEAASITVTQEITNGTEGSTAAARSCAPGPLPRRAAAGRRHDPLHDPRPGRRLRRLHDHRHRDRHRQHPEHGREQHRHRAHHGEAGRRPHHRQDRLPGPGVRALVAGRARSHRRRRSSAPRSAWAA